MDKSVEDLQKEKLELEIKDIKRKWYTRKDYLQILLPTIIALSSLITAQPPIRVLLYCTAIIQRK